MGKTWRAVGLFVVSLLFAITLNTNEVKASEELVYGADIGWLSQLEKQGVTWVDENGTTTDALTLLKREGVNAVRIRAFVNPPSTFMWTKPSGYDVMLGYADTKGVIYTAERAKAQGMKISIVFHYSDHFADPQYQDIPSQWTGATAQQLEKYVYDYTYYVMNELKKSGIYPEWVEVGNEINSGMLFPYGKSTENFGQIAAYLNSGYDAVKAVSPSTKVITHLSNGQRIANYEWFFDQFINTYNGKTDVIGMSYYPYWAGNRVIQDVAYNLNYMATKYGKEVMICETGDHEQNVDITYDLLMKEIAALNSVANDKAIGIFYWEPEANISVTPEGYRLGATEIVRDNTLRFTEAIDAFNRQQSFLESTSSFAIYNCNSGKTLNVQGGSFDNSAIIEQYAYDEWESQMWRFEKVEGNYYKIVNERSGKVIDVEGLSTLSGASCIQYDYNGGWNQMWEIIADSDGQYKVKNRLSGMYLGISNSATDDGSACVQMTDTNTDNTNWYFLVTE